MQSKQFWSNKKESISFLKNVSIFIRDESESARVKNNISKRNDSRKNTNNEQQTKKESTSEKSGEREDGFEGEREEEPLVLCSRIPDEDDDFNEANHHQIQKEEEEGEEDEDEEDEEEITVRKGSEEKERARVRCLREGVSISILLGQTHAYSHERETV